MIRILPFLFCLLFVTQALATTLLYKDFRDLIREAEGVVEGTVEEVTSCKFEQGGIYTYVTLGDLRILKGQYDGDTLTLLFKGGLVDGQGLHLYGSPTFRESERVIAFLKGNGQQMVPLVGWEQGLFRVVTNPQTGERVISDSVGNRVFGIKNGQVIKESRITAEAEILGQPTTGASESEPYRASSGRFKGGQPGQQRSVDHRVRGLDNASQARRAMTLNQFVQSIRQTAERIAAQGPPGEPLTSVQIGDTLKRHGQLDANPPQVQESVPLKRVPNEQGQLPRRIESGADRRIDLE